MTGALAAQLDPAQWRGWLDAGAGQLGYAGFWFAVLRLIFADLLLSGDNAVVIAMACRGLPPRQRRWGIIIGAGAAIVLRIVIVGVLTWLLLLPYFKLIGGIALLVIAARLIVPEAERSEIQAFAHLWRAAMVIAVADIVMSIDNMVAIAAIARGSLVLLAIGLAISIPLIVAGAALVLTLLNRFPILIWAGSALLGWIAGEIIVADPAVMGQITARFGAELASQIEFAAPGTGAALAIAAGGLWRRWHEIRMSAGSETDGA